MTHSELIARVEGESGITIQWLGGNCPVQSEGDIDGHRFYFRARGEGWQFHVAKTDAEIFDRDVFYHEEDYGNGPFDAGWMPESDALDCIAKGARLYRESLCQ